MKIINRSLLRWMLLGLLAVGFVPVARTQQKPGGRYELEYEGALIGGVTGVGATYGLRGGSLEIVLPAVVRSYPTVRLVSGAGLPDRPTQLAVGADGFAVEFSHPDLARTYVARGGSVRVTEVVQGRIRGEFTILATPQDAGAGARELTLRGRFEATQRP